MLPGEIRIFIVRSVRHGSLDDEDLFWDESNIDESREPVKKKGLRGECSRYSGESFYFEGRSV
jgi:hypothetical protein